MASGRFSWQTGCMPDVRETLPARRRRAPRLHHRRRHAHRRARTPRRSAGDRRLRPRRSRRVRDGAPARPRHAHPGRAPRRQPGERDRDERAADSKAWRSTGSGSAPGSPQVGATIGEGGCGPERARRSSRSCAGDETVAAPGPERRVRGRTTSSSRSAPPTGCAAARSPRSVTALVGAAERRRRARVHRDRRGRARRSRSWPGSRRGSASPPSRSTCSPASPSGRAASRRSTSSADFIELAAEIGVLLLLLTLGLEYSPDELRQGLRTGAVPGVGRRGRSTSCPASSSACVLGWEPATAVLLGGVCWVSSSGVVSKVLADLDRLGNRETPAVLNLLVIEDLAMAVYLPVVGAVVAGRRTPATRSSTVAIALAAVAVILDGRAALRRPPQPRCSRPRPTSRCCSPCSGSRCSSAGWRRRSRCRPPSVRSSSVSRCRARCSSARRPSIGPLRDLFAATFFLFFSFPIDPGDLARRARARPRVLAVLGVAGKLRHRLGRGPAARRPARAGGCGPAPRSSRAASSRSSSPRSGSELADGPTSARSPPPTC